MSNYSKALLSLLGFDAIAVLFLVGICTPEIALLAGPFPIILVIALSPIVGMAVFLGMMMTYLKRWAEEG